MIKKIAINLFNQDLKKIMIKDNIEIMKIRRQMISNFCSKCSNCIFQKYKNMINEDPEIIEWIPKKGEIYSKLYQCKEILKIMEGE